MTRRKPLPKGAVAEIDIALWENAEAARAVLAIARDPGADGRLVEVINRIHESSLALKRAKMVYPVDPEAVSMAVIGVLKCAKLPVGAEVLQEIRSCINKVFEV